MDKWSSEKDISHTGIFFSVMYLGVLLGSTKCYFIS